MRGGSVLRRIVSFYLHLLCRIMRRFWFTLHCRREMSIRRHQVISHGDARSIPESHHLDELIKPSYSFEKPHFCRRGNLLQPLRIDLVVEESKSPLDSFGQLHLQNTMIDAGIQCLSSARKTNPFFES